LAALQAERNGRQIETEAAPIGSAAVFGVADQLAAIRWLIALMVLRCDPLAIVLTAAASCGSNHTVCCFAGQPSAPFSRPPEPELDPAAEERPPGERPHGGTPTKPSAICASR
jgi:hypothetical protein